MTNRNAFLTAAAAATLFGCNPNEQQGNGSAGNTVHANETQPAATLCLFEREDTRNWAASTDANQDVVVRGDARVADPKYTARLERPEKNGDQARLWLSVAENSGGIPPTGGWHKVAATIEDDGAIRTVEVWCDHDTMLARMPVRRE
jgi:hypothetical protein